MIASLCTLNELSLVHDGPHSSATIESRSEDMSLVWRESFPGHENGVQLRGEQGATPGHPFATMTATSRAGVTQLAECLLPKQRPPLP